ncbi:MAG: hypothetical protein K9N55_07190 [Phycisphaerae bacterium]|nr:hypothetical protein [Phycisphaerae bacterium]
MKIRMISGIVVCAVMLSLAIVFQAHGDASETRNSAVNSADTSAELTALLERIVDVKGRWLARVEGEHLMDRADYTDVLNAKIELRQAKVRLAKNQGEFDSVVAELRSIVSSREKMRDEAIGKRARGEATTDVLSTELELGQAKVRLAESLGEFDSVVAELQRIVPLREKMRDEAMRRQAMGEATIEETFTATLHWLEAKAAVCTAIVNRN